LLYLAFLAVLAPASTLFWLAHRFVSPAIAVGATSGSLWHGAAQQLTFTPPGGQSIRLHRLAWNIHPSRLLLGQLPVEIEFGSSESKGQGALRLTPSGLDIAQLDASFPAAWLGHIQSKLDLLRPEGTITLRSETFSLRRNHYLGEAEILWQQAATGMSQVKPLGSYWGEIRGKGETLQLQLQTRNGPLELAGDGTWSQRSGIRFNGTAKARERENELAPALKLLGQPDASGVYIVKF
jgi:general secretion pathway protein N